MIKFLEGKILSQKNQLILVEAFPDSKVLLGGRQTYFVLEVPFSYENVDSIVSKPYHRANLNTIIHYLASIEYLERLQKQIKIELDGREIFISIPDIYAVSAFKFQMGHIENTIPILVQKTSSHFQTSYSDFKAKFKLSPLIKMLSRNKFSFDGHYSNWRLVQINQKKVELEYIDFFYYNDYQVLNPLMVKYLSKF